jgi:glycosyltransferase involved in cell wall biosynthesis
MSMIGVLSRATKTANWAIDFVPKRGNNFIAEKAYRAIERFGMRNIDFQIENTTAAMSARIAETGYTPPVQILAPIGVWEESFAVPTIERHNNRSVVYFGSLDERNGAPFLLEVMAAILSTDATVKFHVIGDGPFAEQFTQLKSRFSDQVEYHGYIQSQREIDTILRTAVVALAPYSEGPGLFTEFADPQKLKYYAANGVPVILTDVAPAAAKMNDCGGGSILRYTDGPLVWAQSVLALLNDPVYWFGAATQAHEYGRQFDRTSIYSEALSVIAHHLDGAL